MRVFLKAITLAASLAFITPAFAQTAALPVAVAAPVAASPTVVVAATPAVTEAVKDQVWWAGLANQAITAVVGILGVAIPIVSGFVVQWLRSKSVLARLALTDSLVARLDKGAIGAINSEAERLKQQLGVADDIKDPAVRQTITENATVAVAQNFRETLKTLGITDPDKIQDFVRGRIDKALAKPEIPAVMARS